MTDQPEGDPKIRKREVGGIRKPWYTICGSPQRITVATESDREPEPEQVRKLFLKMAYRFEECASMDRLSAAEHLAVLTPQLQILLRWGRKAGRRLATAGATKEERRLAMYEAIRDAGYSAHEAYDQIGLEEGLSIDDDPDDKIRERIKKSIVRGRERRRLLGQ